MQYQRENYNLLITEQDSRDLANKLCGLINDKPSIICFYGDLGAGKTFICREIIRILIGEDQIVTSPTFNLLNIYNNNNFSIYHYDLYRLKSFEEIYELSIEDALNSHLTLIEWPEIIEAMLPKNNRINLYIDYQDNIRSYKLI